MNHYRRWAPLPKQMTLYTGAAPLAGAVASVLDWAVEAGVRRDALGRVMDAEGRYMRPGYWRRQCRYAVRAYLTAIAMSGDYQTPEDIKALRYALKRNPRRVAEYLRIISYEVSARLPVAPVVAYEYRDYAQAAA